MRSDPVFLYKFIYHAHFEDRGAEHELCWVYAGRSSDPVRANPNEIAEWKYMKPSQLDEALQHQALYGARLGTNLVDLSMISFGPAGALPIRAALEDVNMDGFVDVVVHFRTQEAGLGVSDTQACLLGARADDGSRFRGCDAIVTR